MEQLEAGSTMCDPQKILATVHAVRGEKEEAYRWLEEAIEAGWRNYAPLLRDPIWADFHNEERFQQMMADVKAKVDVMRQRVREMEKEWDLE
jgi:hypothetical protein